MSHIHPFFMLYKDLLISYNSYSAVRIFVQLYFAFISPFGSIVKLLRKKRDAMIAAIKLLRFFLKMLQETWRNKDFEVDWKIDFDSRKALKFLLFLHRHDFHEILLVSTSAELEEVINYIEFIGILVFFFNFLFPFLSIDFYRIKFSALPVKRAFGEC